LRLVDEMEVAGKGKVGRPSTTWKVTVKRDLEVFGVDENMTFDRRRYGGRSLQVDPTPT